MPIVFFTMPPFVRHKPVAVDPKDLGGEDVAFLARDFGVTPAGDWATVREEAAVRQSVLREIPPPPGSFPRRPEWGAGLSSLLFKGNTKDVRDLAVSQTRARLAANSRIVKINEVSAAEVDGGFAMTVRVDGAGGPVEVTPVIKPPGVA